MTDSPCTTTFLDAAMGIFDEVFGRKIEGDGGGLFSDKYKAERDILHDPLPASAYVDVLKRNDELLEKMAKSGKGMAREEFSDSDGDSDGYSDEDDSSDSDSDSERPAKKPKKKERSKYEEMDEAFAEANAVMAEGEPDKRKKSAAAAAEDTSDDDSGSEEDDESDSDAGSDDEDDEGAGASSDSDSLTDVEAERAARKAARDEAKAKKAAAKQAKEQQPGEEHRPQDDALPRTVFVGNLPVTIKPKKLKTLFSEFGVVDSVRLRNVPVDPEGKMPRGGKVITGKLVENRKSTNAYVVFKEEKSVEAACKGMNMREVDGHHVRVDRAVAPSAKANEMIAKEKGANAGGEVAYDHTRSLFLGNLPYDVDEEDVIRLFHRSKEYPELNGAVEAVRVVRDRKTNLGKGIAFVLFRKGSDARTGLLLDGTKMGEREVRVTRASKNREALKAQAEKSKKRKADKEAKKEPQGAARRLGLDKAPDAKGSAAAWEGSRSRPGGKRQKIAFGGYDAAIERGKDGKKGAGGKGGGKPAAKGARTGKRPAVAARKAKAKAQAAAGKKK